MIHLLRSVMNFTDRIFLGSYLFIYSDWGFLQRKSRHLNLTGTKYNLQI